MAVPSVTERGLKRHVAGVPHKALSFERAPADSGRLPAADMRDRGPEPVRTWSVEKKCERRSTQATMESPRDQPETGSDEISPRRRTRLIRDDPAALNPRGRTTRSSKSTIARPPSYITIH